MEKIRVLDEEFLLRQEILIRRQKKEKTCYKTLIKKHFVVNSHM